MTEERISRLEGAYEQVDRRLGDLTQAVAALRTEVGSLRDELHSEVGSLRDEVRGDIDSLRGEMNHQYADLRSEMNSRFNNLYVLAGGAWVTTVGLIIGLFFQN